MTILGIIVAILIFGILVLTHELGHFLAARWMGIGIVEFSIGMGPRILSRKKGDTIYSLKAIPLGGSCRMVGEDAAGGGEVSLDDNEKDVSRPDSFQSKSVWARMLVVVAGPLFNFVLAFLLGIVLTIMAGTDPAIVYGVAGDSPAYEAGLQIGDQIIGINDSSINLRNDVSLYKFAHDITNKPVKLTILREDEKLDLYYTATDKLGVSLGYSYVSPSFGDVIKGGFNQISYNVRAVFYSLKSLIMGQSHVSDLAGPVGMATIITDTITASKSDGFKYIIMNLVDISILLAANLGTVNMIPFPALDGGRFLLLIVEAITRKKLPVKIEATINFIGFALLMLLMVIVMFNDVLRIF